MPFNPSDFAWWVWLLFVLGAAVVLFIAAFIAASADDDNLPILSYPFGFLAIINALVVLGCLLIAVVRFVKWVWGG